MRILYRTKEHELAGKVLHAGKWEVNHKSLDKTVCIIRKYGRILPITRKSDRKKDGSRRNLR